MEAEGHREPLRSVFPVQAVAKVLILENGGMVVE